MKFTYRVVLPIGYPEKSFRFENEKDACGFAKDALEHDEEPHLMDKITIEMTRDEDNK